MNKSLGAEDSSPAAAAGGRLYSTQVFSPHEVFKNLDSGEAYNDLVIKLMNCVHSQRGYMYTIEADNIATDAFINSQTYYTVLTLSDSMVLKISEHFMLTLFSSF